MYICLDFLKEGPCMGLIPFLFICIKGVKAKLWNEEERRRQCSCRDGSINWKRVFSSVKMHVTLTPNFLPSISQIQFSHYSAISSSWFPTPILLLHEIPTLPSFVTSFYMLHGMHCWALIVTLDWSRAWRNTPISLLFI